MEPGETFEEAAVREALEETGLPVRLKGLASVRDQIVREGRRVRFHYVIAVFAAEARGRLRAGSDAAAARWVPLPEAGRLDLTATTRSFLRSPR